MKPLLDRKPSEKTLTAMAAASKIQNAIDGEDLETKCKKALSNSTGHKKAAIVESGGQAISLVLSAIWNSVLLPDQGIWGGTLKLCNELGIRTNSLTTELGLIDPGMLEKAFEENCPKALLITSFAGYIAEQNLEWISQICRQHDVLLIEDASSAIGDKKLGKGKHADVIVASTREPKLLNLFSGGFITTSDENIMDKVTKLNSFSADLTVCAGIYEELRHAQETIDKLTEISNRLKEKVESVVHRKHRGICVGALHKNPKKVAKEARRQNLITRSGRALLSTCPRYDRFLDEGVVVELKKVDPGSIDEKILTDISNLLEK
jgi:aspartate aminotransferase-like enzyme